MINKLRLKKNIKKYIIIPLLFLYFNSPAQYKFKEHKISLAFTLSQGLFDGLRDASMFGRVNYGRWWNSDLDSWKLKYQNEDYKQGAKYFGSTTFLVGFTDAPHAANTVSNFSGEMAKVYMPNLSGLNFGRKVLIVAAYSIVRGTGRNIVDGLLFKIKN